MKIYAFDVDDTLEVSGGPISIVNVGSLNPTACRRFTYRLDVQSPEREERVVELLQFMERSCYATNTLRQPVQVVPRLVLNGHPVQFSARN